MESERLPASSGYVDDDAAFRKPSNDAANRKYRRRSPGSASSSDGSPKDSRSPSPIHSREYPARDYDPRPRKDEGRDLERDSGRRYHGRGDSYRPSDRRSSRSSHHYHKRDDYERHEKHADDGIYSKTSYHSGRESRGHVSDYARKEGGHYRSRDHSRGDDKYNRGRYDSSRGRSGERASSPHENKYKDKNSKVDNAELESHLNSNVEEVKSVERDIDKREADSRYEKRDYQKGYGEYRDDHSPIYGEPRGRRNDSTSQRSCAVLREASKIDSKEVDGQYRKKEDKKKSDQRSSRFNDPYSRETGELLEDKAATNSEDHESSAKKQKIFSTGACHGKVSKFTTGAGELQSSSAKQEPAVTSEHPPTQGFVTASDIDAAKVAAMRAAELVNRNLIGTGYMSADQKKKLLWGNKKNTMVHEPTGHRWDAAQFADREQLEKFNKLMGVKGEPKVESSSGVHLAEKQKELEQDLEKQYIAGLRRRDGRTVGLGL